MIDFWEIMGSFSPKILPRTGEGWKPHNSINNLNRWRFKKFKKTWNTSFIEKLKKNSWKCEFHKNCRDFPSLMDWMRVSVKFCFWIFYFFFCILRMDIAKFFRFMHSSSISTLKWVKNALFVAIFRFLQVEIEQKCISSKRCATSTLKIRMQKKIRKIQVY